MKFQDILSYIAQGVINVDTGHTTIEKDSRVYKAMTALIDRAHEGSILFKEKTNRKPPISISIVKVDEYFVVQIVLENGNTSTPGQVFDTATEAMDYIKEIYL